MTENKFDRLLGALPKIAEGVNAFSSAEVQVAAFDALVRALDLPDPHGAPHEDDDTVTVEEVQESGDASDTSDTSGASGGSSGPKKATKRTRTTSKKTFTVPKGLNFAPAGKDSFEAVVAVKKPSTQMEKNLVAVHYLQEYMGETAIETGTVLAAWRAASWSAPPQPDVVLRNTAVKGWIDTSDMSDIKVVWQGENYFDTKMPTESKAAK